MVIGHCRSTMDIELGGYEREFVLQKTVNWAKFFWALELQNKAETAAVGQNES